MEKRFFRSRNKIYFPSVKQYLSNGRYFYEDNGHIFVLMDTGDVLDFGTDCQRLNYLLDSGSVSEIDSKEYNEHLNRIESGSVSNFRPNTEIKSATTSYQRVAKTVPADNRFEVIDSQRIFNRPRPIHTQEFNGIKKKASEGNLVDKYQSIQIPESQKLKPTTQGEVVQNLSPEGSMTKNMPLVPIEIPMEKNERESDFEKSWKAFSNLTSAKKKREYLEAITFVSVIEFFVARMDELLELEEDGHSKITKTMRKQYMEFREYLSGKLSQSRMELKA